MTARIPPELMFHIISFLQDDKATLSACSLCCSALAAASKPLLFHTLCTGLDLKATDRFECLLESGAAILPLIKRIDMPIPTFGPGVDQRTIGPIYRILARQGTPPTLNIAIRPIGPSLYRSVRLLLSWLNPVVHWVTSLELDDLDLTGGDNQFWDIVLAFPKLKSLTLGCVVVVGDGVRISSHSESGISHLSLRRSALGGVWDIRRFLADHLPPLPSLTSLDVRFPTVMDRTSIRFEEQYGPTVRTLRFGVVIAHRPTMDLGELDCKFSATRLVHRATLILPAIATTEFISQFSNLETLTLQGLFVPIIPAQRPSVTFEWIPTALNGVSSTVRKFTMEVIAAHLSYLDIIPWSAIDERLAHQLQSVTVVEVLLATPVGTNYLLENVSQEMGKRLPLAAQRGVLRCSAVAEHPV